MQANAFPVAEGESKELLEDLLLDWKASSFVTTRVDTDLPHGDRPPVGHGAAQSLLGRRIKLPRIFRMTAEYSPNMGVYQDTVVHFLKREDKF